MSVYPFLSEANLYNIQFQNSFSLHGLKGCYSNLFLERILCKQ